MKPIASSTRSASASASSAVETAAPGRRHRAEEDAGERVLHRVVDLPVAGARARRARCRGRRRTSSAPPARGSARSRAPTGRPGSRSGCTTAAGPPRGTRGARRCAFSHGSWWPVSAAWIVLRAGRLDPLEDRLEERLLAGVVVVERALGDVGAGDDRVERGGGVPVLGEQLARPRRPAPAWWRRSTAHAGSCPARAATSASRGPRALGHRRSLGVSGRAGARRRRSADGVPR